MRGSSTCARSWASATQGLVALAAVGATYAGAAYVGLPSSQRGALAFVALVAGNLGLVVVHRSGPALRKLQGRDLAFCAVAAPTLVLLAAIASVPAVAAWFGFEPPPPLATVLALLLPWGALWAARSSLARLRNLFSRGMHQRNRSG